VVEGIERPALRCSPISAAVFPALLGGIERPADTVAVALAGAVAITAAVVLADECLSRSFALAGVRLRVLARLRR
jgi:hypothetical protein